MTCAVTDCEKSAKTTGLCGMHYMRLWRSGNVEPRTLNADRGCSVDGCENYVHARGWCHLHYTRVLRTGDPGPAGPIRQASSLSVRERILRARLNPRRAEKPCSVCGVMKPVADYPFGSSTVDGRGAACKPCAAARTREHYHNRDKTTDPVAEKFCTGCLANKKADKFYKDTSDPTGLQGYCKECQSVLSAGGTVYDIRRELGLSTERIRTCWKRSAA